MELIVTRDQLAKLAFLVARSNARNRMYHAQGEKHLAAEMSCFANGILEAVETLGLKLDMKAANKAVDVGDTTHGWI